MHLLYIFILILLSLIFCLMFLNFSLSKIFKDHFNNFSIGSFCLWQCKLLIAMILKCVTGWITSEFGLHYILLSSYISFHKLKRMSQISNSFWFASLCLGMMMWQESFFLLRFKLGSCSAVFHFKLNLYMKDAFVLNY